MEEDKPIDPNLLKRMMMGDFSAVFSSPKEIKKSSSPKRKVELDLHFDKLFPHSNSTPANQRLPMQMESLKDFVADCRKQSVTSAYIIVGKGDGILRSKVKQELQRIKIRNSEVADPPYFGNAVKVYF